VSYLVLTPTGRYLLRAGWEEGKILARRRPIAALVASDSTPPRIRQKLRLVLAARAFAADSIRLKVEESFTTYSRLDRDTLVLVLSGAYRDRLRPKSWWFPVVGRVPYKGYFDFGAARKAARALEGEGFDVYLRPASAFSTLGWFNDPLLPTTLRADSIDLANTVIHEVTHTTFYAPGQAVFNESFANFVGARGAGWFFRARGDTASAGESDRRWADEKLMARFWDHLYRAVDSTFEAHPGDDSAAVRTRLALRDSIYRAARRALVDSVGPRLRTIDRRYLERVRLDNAALLARRVYATDLEVFDAVWVREGGDLRRAIARIIELANGDEEDPFGAMKRWVAGASLPAAR
jgi:predicted aminopeptidase